MSSQIRIHPIRAFAGFSNLLRTIGSLPVPLSNCTQRSWFTILAFYALILGEMLSQSPLFSAIIRGIFSPVFYIFHGHPAHTWLSSYFLPQYTKTSSGLANDPNWIVTILIMGGLLVFGAGAAQLYPNNPAYKRAATRGIYRFMRHPQYAGLAVCGMGMLLLWPRYFDLLTYIAMLFGCYCLGRIEEHECKQKFGQAYIDYKRRTGMFLPFRLPFTQRLPRLPRCGLPRFLAIVILYVIVTLAAVAFTNLIDLRTLDNFNAPCCV